jgi:hypothetical protein
MNWAQEEICSRFLVMSVEMETLSDMAHDLLYLLKKHVGSALSLQNLYIINIVTEHICNFI